MWMTSHEAFMTSLEKAGIAIGIDYNRRLSRPVVGNAWIEGNTELRRARVDRQFSALSASARQPRHSTNV